MRVVIPRTRESARAGITALASLRPGSQLHRCASIISGGRKNQFGQSGLACLHIDRQLSRGARCGHPRIPARWRVRRSRLPALRRWQGRKRGRSQETGAAQGVNYNVLPSQRPKRSVVRRPGGAAVGVWGDLE
jgi:hypothetical protein